LVCYKFIKYFSVSCESVYCQVATNSCFVSNMTILSPYLHASSYSKYAQKVCHTMSKGRDSVVSITTCYGLNGLGIESWWEVRFSSPIQTAPGVHQPPIPVMGKLFKEGAKGKEKNFRRANIIY